MKLSRICILPFALVADACTLGNIGAERSFTQQVFDAERREQRQKEERELLRDLVQLAEGIRRLR